MCEKKEVSVSIIIPVYNTGFGLFSLHQRIADALRSSGYDWRLVLVDDSSSDDSWSVITTLCKNYSNVSGINLSKNQGQHRAIALGLAAVDSEIYVTMDDDLQHDPSDIITLLSALTPSSEVIYGRFSEREHPTWKRVGSVFNDLTSAVLIRKPFGLYLSPFRALRKNVRNYIIDYQGESIYIDGLILRSTNRIKETEVRHSKRQYGQSHYGIRKSVMLWASMVFGFSLAPLRLASYLGVILSFFGLAGVTYVTIMSYLNETPPGWASLLVSMIFLGGFQLLSLGIIGEYVGRVTSALLFPYKPPIAARLNLD